MLLECGTLDGFSKSVESQIHGSFKFWVPWTVEDVEQRVFGQERVRVETSNLPALSDFLRAATGGNISYMVAWEQKTEREEGERDIKCTAVGDLAHILVHGLHPWSRKVDLRAFLDGLSTQKSSEGIIAVSLRVFCCSR